MSAGGDTGFGGAGKSQDFDINIAPIIDCFTVLIAFMLVSATFLSIGIFDAGIAAGGASSANTDQPPPISITVTLKQNKSIDVVVEGKAKINRAIASITGKESPWNLPELTEELQKLKVQWPMVQAMTLIAEPQVEYADVIKAMEVSKKTLPAILLGGF